MKEHKYKISFSSQLSPFKSENDKDKFISLASKNDNIKKLLPKNSDLSKNIGFLLFTGESFVANLLNANNDGVKTEEAIKIANEFPLTYVDINHKRDRLCGVVVAATYTDYKTGKELSEEDVKSSKEPFSVTITGIVWRAPNPELADAIENMNASDSPLKDSIFLSWELAFDDAELVIMDAKNNRLYDGEVVTNKQEIEKLSKRLVSNGGNGLTEDGKKIGRIAIGDVVVLGVGLVENPAAAVSHIEVSNTNESTASINNEDLNKLITDKIIDILKNQKGLYSGGIISENGIIKNLQISENKISQPQISNVKANNDIFPTMKIEKLDQITDENLKDLKKTDLQEIFASSTKEIVDTKIKELSADYVTKIASKDKDIEDAKKTSEELKTTVKDLENKVIKASEDLNKVLEENKKRELVEAFSARMETIENSFDLDDKQKEIVANKIKTLTTDDEFNKYLEEINVLLAAKKKSKKNDNDEDDKKNKMNDKNQSQASATTTNTNVIDQAIQNGKKDDVVIPNVATGSETLVEKAKRAFGIEGWVVSNKRKNRI